MKLVTYRNDDTCVKLSDVDFDDKVASIMVPSGYQVPCNKEQQQQQKKKKKKKIMMMMMMMMMMMIFSTVQSAINQHAQTRVQNALFPLLTHSHTLTHTHTHTHTHTQHHTTHTHNTHTLSVSSWFYHCSCAMMCAISFFFALCLLYHSIFALLSCLPVGLFCALSELSLAPPISFLVSLFDLLLFLFLSSFLPFSCQCCPPSRLRFSRFIFFFLFSIPRWSVSPHFLHGLPFLAFRSFCFASSGKRYF